jgi:hypothetical protein
MISACDDNTSDCMSARDEIKSWRVFQIGELTNEKFVLGQEQQQDLF